MHQRKLDVKVGLPMLARTTSAEGTAIDLKAYLHTGGREMKAFFACLAPLTASTLDVTIQENTTSASAGFTDITGAAFTQVAGTAAVTGEEIHFKTNKRYVRAYATYGTTATSITFGTWLLAEARMV